MTICIAVIADNKDVIAIADKKLTLNHGLTSVYEISENKKIVQLTPKCVAMFAGNVVAANEILKLAKKTIQATDDVSGVAHKISNAYAEKLREAIDTQILQKYSLDLDKFNAQQRVLDPTFVGSVIETINNASLGVEILVVGKDGERPQLFKMLQNGAIEDGTPIGYACIGSGASHANLSLIESEAHAAHDRGSIIYALIKAKKKAEFDPNVGHMSSMVLVNDGVQFVDDSIVEDLWKEYDKSVISISRITKKSSIIMKGLAYGTDTAQS
jgi:20S proteasome alpha/beta subunit